ncbi:hypothetical protein PHYSODRAFT_327400 [Phytophthora sojae]|uniref:Uncharacterized protein n=1 Tax=Phytophthora sojae (strain P6497) TaxID=1094619 RepID=G4Z8P0_PHYSP|nr:hypothetical protein PHYSODRAFT_327396 [Phytophthora sojae]XP_009521791.1 hypothetical protein PHYSODRAFT_327398 [Phytophthora sojae]XP_009521793.1 hypothetical protein PHYSODRAFT_327400 [Phytophthora sojae]EGZ19072.1 hypothetical protein PHYSODRAFT_327396 [Phytophthora sojae]EGZ19074.1 hypothetical protein PHYSODRAFT_327398 [Phytophthora sojae]EGZ19076.1 hypothetical protein PHYSODRAFT_327400 [Phytophthora sojae]|eukprot:XP_009521789.1 hypothetical protein PHYSODRAFT_327396 [Phytophthora sojae]
MPPTSTGQVPELHSSSPASKTAALTRRAPPYRRRHRLQELVARRAFTTAPGPGSSPTVSTVPFNGDLQLVSVLTPLFTCREAAGVIISRHGARVMHSRKAKLCRAPRSAELRALPAFRVLSCQCSRAQSSTLNVPIEAAVEAAATLLVVGSIPLATSKDDELLVGFCGAPILKCAYLSVRGF